MFSKHDAQAACNLAWYLDGRLPKYDNTDSRSVTEIVIEVKSQVKVLSFYPKEIISIFGFLATLQLVCETDNIDE